MQKEKNNKEWESLREERKELEKGKRGRMGMHERREERLVEKERKGEELESMKEEKRELEKGREGK